MCGGKMRKINRFNAATTLGSLTAAVALLAGMPAAFADPATDSSDTSVSGQAAPGGGAFPGSFLVPGTNTSIKIGGFAKGTYIYDLSAADGAPNNATVVAPGAIPLEGTVTHQARGALRFHAKQSNFNFDARTPTAWGELDVFILSDFFGQNVSNTFANSNTENARLVLAYGTLGPLLGGQTLSLFYDGDAQGETVDPTATVGIMNGLTNRHPQIRYTYVAGGGLSAAVSAEQPVWEVQDNGTALGAGVGGVQTTASSATGWSRYPDGIARVRLDQAWGHVALTGAVRDQSVKQAGARLGGAGYGVELTGHLNTIGKDALKAQALWGKAIGHYLSDMGALAGLEANSAAGFSNKKPQAYGFYAAYTHWWTNELRSSLSGGYSHLDVDTSIITSAAAQNARDKLHVGGVVNLIWSPVPQVDIGLEYIYVHRVTAAPNGAVGSSGQLNRIEAETVFKF